MCVNSIVVCYYDKIDDHDKIIFNQGCYINETILREFKIILTRDVIYIKPILREFEIKFNHGFFLDQSTLRKFKDSPILIQNLKCE